jgi:hypothetical protein
LLLGVKLAPRGEHSLLFRDTSPLGDKIHPWGQSLPLGGKVKNGPLESSFGRNRFVKSTSGRYGQPDTHQTRFICFARKSFRTSCQSQVFTRYVLNRSLAFITNLKSGKNRKKTQNVNAFAIVVRDECVARRFSLIFDVLGTDLRTLWKLSHSNCLSLALWAQCIT